MVSPVAAGGAALEGASAAATASILGSAGGDEEGDFAAEVEESVFAETVAFKGGGRECSCVMD